eukprot:scaffold185311_cov51-Cyclotella_meneghiniana.AAC.2
MRNVLSHWWDGKHIKIPTRVITVTSRCGDLGGKTIVMGRGSRAAVIIALYSTRRRSGCGRQVGSNSPCWMNRFMVPPSAILPWRLKKKLLDADATIITAR